MKAGSLKPLCLVGGSGAGSQWGPPELCMGKGRPRQKGRYRSVGFRTDPLSADDCVGQP